LHFDAIWVTFAEGLGNTLGGKCLPRAEGQEERMTKCLIAIAAVLFIILSAGMVTTYRAEAGASASAATKYSKASSRGSWFTDYSSSSRRR
jgi:preprotein translocase subunit SecG